MVLVFGLLQLWFLAHLVCESELPGLNTLINCFLELKDVDAALAASASQQIQRGVEHDSFNVGLAVSTLQLLHHVSAVRAKDFNDMASAAGTGKQGSLWIDCNCSDLGVVSRNEQINALVDN